MDTYNINKLSHLPNFKKGVVEDEYMKKKSKHINNTYILLNHALMLILGGRLMC